MAFQISTKTALEAMGSPRAHREAHFLLMLLLPDSLFLAQAKDNSAFFWANPALNPCVGFADGRVLKGCVWPADREYKECWKLLSGVYQIVLSFSHESINNMSSIRCL